MPFEFTRGHDGSLPVESAVFQALGAASMCWSETPKGIFDSTRVKEIGDKLLEFLGHPQTNPYAGVLVKSGESFEVTHEYTSETPQVVGYTETSGAGQQYPKRDSLRFGEDL
jgi:hypothetical protein